MRLLRGIILVVTAVVSIGYGRYVVGAGSDPLHGLRGPYLIGYGIAPLICVLAASDAWRAARDVVLVRSGSVSRWWRDRVGAGATAGGQLALAMVGGTMVARVGLPVPSVGEVVASVLAPVLVVLGITMISHGVAALTALIGRTALVVAVVAWWVAILVAGRRAASLSSWANPSRLMTHPVDAVHLVWPVLMMAAIGHVVDLVRQGRWQVIVRPALVYGAVGLACLGAQATSGTPVVQADGGVLAEADLIPQTLNGVGAGGGVRQLLFVIILWLGHPAAFAADLAMHRHGSWHQELIRVGSVGRWYWRRCWPWLLSAPVVPLVSLVVAQLAVWALGSATPLSAGDALHVAATGTLQLIVYLLVMLVVQLLHGGPAGTIIALVGLSALTFVRHAGVPVPAIAMNGLPEVAAGGTLGTCAVLAGAAAALAAGVAILARHIPPDWSSPS